MNSIFASSYLIYLRKPLLMQTLKFAGLASNPNIHNISKTHSYNRVFGALYSTSSPALKDKNFKDAGAGPRKSQFASNNNDGEKVKTVRSDEELAKLKQERLAREEKKKEIQKRQLEIQKKRDEAKLSKASKPKPQPKQDKDD